MDISQHRYDYQARDFSALFTNTPRLVIDVGCGSGLNGKVLKEKLGCRVYGVEPREAEARKAEAVLDRCYAKPFDRELISTDLAGERIDGVLFADVLEHIYDPWAVLRATRECLADDGLVVASIPNVRNVGLLHDVMVKGTFKYVTAGLLDMTHIRFFAWKNIQQLFADTGFVIRSVTSALDPSLIGMYNLYKDLPTPFEAQFGGLKMTIDSPSTLLELFTFQFMVVAEKAK